MLRNARRLSVCLSVCLFGCYQLYVKTTERIFMKILSQVYLCTRKNGLNFGSHPPTDLDPEIFERFFNIER